MSLMDAIRAAVTGSARDEQPVVISSALSEAEILAARQKAHEEGFKLGYANQTARWKSVMTHPNIKGIADRMTAAMDLLQLAPNMAADDIVHAVEAARPHDMRAEYEASRFAALAAVGGPWTAVN